ncbi:MAG: hypothetical protein M3458_14805 [Acidobacteriota bacterium]|nr:hypothetical protein [Acidobacteriota bacterium]
MADYATLLEAKAVYLQSLDTPDEPAVSALLTSASRAIDGVTKREENAFAASPALPTPKVVYGSGETCLVIPEHVKNSITTITTVTGLTAPAFAEYHGRLCVVDSRGVFLRSDVWQDGVPYTITARWGFASIPADINQACLKLVDFWWKTKSGALSGTIGNITQDGRLFVRDDFPASVMRLLAPYVLQERENDRAGLVEFGDLQTDEFNVGGY